MFWAKTIHIARLVLNSLCSQGWPWTPVSTSECWDCRPMTTDPVLCRSENQTQCFKHIRVGTLTTETHSWPSRSSFEGIGPSSPGIARKFAQPLSMVLHSCLSRWLGAHGPRGAFPWVCAGVATDLGKPPENFTKARLYKGLFPTLV